MSDDRASMRRIYGSTLIVGGATLAAILVGVARSKILALWVGPEGIGLLGILNSIVTFAATLSAMGLARSGAHQIATERDEPAVAIRSLMLASWILAVSGAVLLWLLREPIARLVTGSPTHAAAIGIASLGVMLLVLSGSQLAILQGLRRVAELAQVRIGGAIIGSVLAVLAVYEFGLPGLALVVVAIPLGDVLVARLFLSRIKTRARPDWPTVKRQWSAMLRFGLVTMVCGVMTSSTSVFVRATLVDGIGVSGAGLYQAAWSIAVMNVTLVLAAFGADYFPSLAALSRDKDSTNRLVNQQFHATLILLTPLLFGIAAMSGYVLQILYSSEFRGGALLLQLHTVGDLFKLTSWILGLVVLARRDLGPYVALEAAFTVTYIVAAALLVPKLGLNGAGVAYCLAYAVHAIGFAWRCRQAHRITLGRRNLGHLALILIAQLALLLLAVSGFAMLHLALGLALTVLFGLIALTSMARSTDWHKRIFSCARGLLRWRK